MSAAWYFPYYLPPVSLTPVAHFLPVSLIQVANYHQRCWHRRQICRRCHWHRWCTLTCEYLREFSRKFEMTLMLFSGAWGNVIHEKNLKKKSRDNLPLILQFKFPLCEFKFKYCKIINPTQVRILQIIYKIKNMFSKAWLWKYVQTRNQHKYISFTCTAFEMVL